MCVLTGWRLLPDSAGARTQLERTGRLLYQQAIIPRLLLCHAMHGWVSLMWNGVGHPRGRWTAGVTASGRGSTLMSEVAVAYTMEGGFYTRVPSLSSSLKYMAAQITNGSKPVLHKATTRHDKIGVKVAHLNVGTMHGRAGEITETLSCRRGMYAVCKKQGGGEMLQEWSQAEMIGTNYFGSVATLELVVLGLWWLRSGWKRCWRLGG